MTRRAGSLGRASLAIVGCIAIQGCGTSDVVVAEVTTPVTTGNACTTSRDCMPGEYCEMPGCDAAAGSGTCQGPSTCTDDTPKPVCGCPGDGLIYWNDCIRQKHGAPASQSCRSPTATPMPCDRDRMPCGPGSYCAEGACEQWMQSDGGPPGTVPFTCLVLPDPCPPDTSGFFFSTCDMSSTCMDYCTAIRNEQPFKLQEPFRNHCQ